MCIAFSKGELIQEEQTIDQTANLYIARGATKIKVCHFAKSDNIRKLVEVNKKSMENHLNHGDILLDDDGDGYAVLNTILMN